MVLWLGSMVHGCACAATTLAHRAEKWTRFSAKNDALLQGGSIGSVPKVESTFHVRCSRSIDVVSQRGSGEIPVPRMHRIHQTTFFDDAGERTDHEPDHHRDRRCGRH